MRVPLPTHLPDNSVVPIPGLAYVQNELSVHTKAVSWCQGWSVQLPIRQATQKPCCWVSSPGGQPWDDVTGPTQEKLESWLWVIKSPEDQKLIKAIYLKQ